MQEAATDMAATTGSRLDVMNFLNEAAESYPEAISFASGRPAEQFFDIRDSIAQIPRFLAHWSEITGRSLDESASLLGQYGPTNGIISDLIARQVALDEGIVCEANQVFVTSGCQEALLLCCRELCAPGKDVILVRNPTYIGITGVADLSGIELHAIEEEGGESFPESLGRALHMLRRQGRRPRLLYLIPNFDNPTGATLSLQDRLAVLEQCGRHGVIVLEDNPYGMFRFEGEALPSLFTLDRFGLVLYVGTYSKTLCPNVRVGFVVAPPVAATAQELDGVMTKLGRAKSFGSLNTSQLMQAAVGGTLIDQGYSLSQKVATANGFYHANRDLMCAALETAPSVASGAVQVSKAQGGFFLVLELPSLFGAPQLRACAQEYGVLVLPLSFFAFDSRQNHRVRLAYSNVTPAQIEVGVDRLLTFLSRTY